MGATPWSPIPHFQRLRVRTLKASPGSAPRCTYWASDPMCHCSPLTWRALLKKTQEDTLLQEKATGEGWALDIEQQLSAQVVLTITPHHLLLLLLLLYKGSVSAYCFLEQLQSFLFSRPQTEPCTEPSKGTCLPCLSFTLVGPCHTAEHNSSK